MGLLLKGLLTQFSGENKSNNHSQDSRNKPFFQKSACSFKGSLTYTMRIKFLVAKDEAQLKKCTVYPKHNHV